jgi:hypothetical protein
MNTPETPPASLETLQVTARERHKQLLTPQYDPGLVYQTFLEIFDLSATNMVAAGATLNKHQSTFRRLEDSNITAVDKPLATLPNSNGIRPEVKMEWRSTYKSVPDEKTGLTEKLLIDETEEVLIRLRFAETSAANFQWKMVEVADRLYLAGNRNFESLFFASFEEAFIDLIEIFSTTRPDLIPALAASFKVAASEGIRISVQFIGELFKEAENMAVPGQTQQVRAKIRAALGPFQFYRIHSYTESAREMGVSQHSFLQRHQPGSPVEAYVAQCPFNGFAKYLIEQSITAFESILSLHDSKYPDLTFTSIPSSPQLPIEVKIANHVQEVFKGAQSYPTPPPASESE